MTEPTHYDVLKLRSNVTQDKIRAAYKNLSRLYHPDMNPDDPRATQIMARINVAYDVLSDPDLRAKYDASLAPPPPPPSPPPVVPPRVRPRDGSGIFPRDAAGPDSFDMPEFGGGGAPRPRPRPNVSRPQRRVDPDAEQAEANREFVRLAAKRAFALIVVAVLLIALCTATYHGSGRGTVGDWLFFRALRKVFGGW